MTNNSFTKTQTAILAVLADGQLHTREELHACLPDELSGASAVRFHVSNIRKSLRPKGQDIICQLKNRRIFYRHVRLLTGFGSG